MGEMIVKAVIKTQEGVEVILGNVENNETVDLYSEKFDHEPSDDEIEKAKDKFKKAVEERKKRGRRW